MYFSDVSKAFSNNFNPLLYSIFVSNSIFHFQTSKNSAVSMLLKEKECNELTSLQNYNGSYHSYFSQKSPTSTQYHTQYTYNKHNKQFLKNFTKYSTTESSAVIKMNKHRVARKTKKNIFLRQNLIVSGP